jgi:hypothetical protein
MQRRTDGKMDRRAKEDKEIETFVRVWHHALQDSIRRKWLFQGEDVEGERKRKKRKGPLYITTDFPRDGGNVQEAREGGTKKRKDEGTGKRICRGRICMYRYTYMYPSALPSFRLLPPPKRKDARYRPCCWPLNLLSFPFLCSFFLSHFFLPSIPLSPSFLPPFLPSFQCSFPSIPPCLPAFFSSFPFISPPGTNAIPALCYSVRNHQAEIPAG